MKRNSGTFRLSSASLHDMTLIIVIQLLLHLFLTAKACTEIRVTTEDKSTVVIGRSMEWSSDLRPDIIVEPQGYFHKVNLSVYCTNTDHAGAPLQNWTNRYTVIYLNAYGRDVASDGMNSEGLTVGALSNLTLPSTRYISSPNSPIKSAYRAPPSRANECLLVQCMSMTYPRRTAGRLARTT